MYYSRLLLLLVIAVSSCRASVEYTWASKTLSGKPCLSTCSNGKCYVNHHLQPTACKVDPVAGVAEHPTAQWRGSIPKCLSNCGKWGGYSYMWCYTTEQYDWDYCNDEIYTPGVNPGRDIYGRRCVDECNVYPSSYNSEAQCHLESQEYVTCTRAGHIPVQSCSAIFQSMRRSQRALDKIFSPTYCSATCRGRYRDGRDGETRERADAVYSMYNNVNNITQFPAGSPYRFVATTTVTNTRNEQVLLPLIMQARLDAPVYTPRGDDEVTPEGVQNVNRMYDVSRSQDRPGIQVGHLLAYSNGGTTDLFNYAGQTQQLNVGPYKTVENVINSWLRTGYVEFTVVVTYAGTRPSEFSVKVKLYESNGALHSDCLDMIFSNI